MNISILGTRGVPARHGGFETFAEQYALWLADAGHNVTVYCQAEGCGKIIEDTWRGVRRVHIPERFSGAAGTIWFDLRSALHAAREKTVILTLGYNTAVFSIFHRFAGQYNIINMDGIEWKRQKYTLLPRIWLYFNELCAGFLGNHLVADHPEIKKYLKVKYPEKKITVIPYGAEYLTDADPTPLLRLGVAPGDFALVIARPEPENSILEIVRAFSSRPRGKRLVVLGNYDSASNPYHRQVREAASPEVLFPGACYEKDVLAALRTHAALYIHGHQVGGTNPSLVEALGAGSPVLARDTEFNRWVAGPMARFFASEEECARHLDELLDDQAALRAMHEGSHRRFLEEFQWETIFRSYDSLIADRAFGLR